MVKYLFFILIVPLVMLLTASESCSQGSTQKIVPDQYVTIQSAIDAALTGDTILVKPGSYTGGVDFKGKEILVTSLFRLTNDTSYISKTIITDSYPSGMVWFKNGETSKSELSGFTLTGFLTTAAIEIFNAAPTLSSLRLTNNISHGSAVIVIDAVGLSSPVNLQAVETTDAPIYVENTHLIVTNCVLKSGTLGRSGIVQKSGELTMINSLLEENGVITVCGSLDFNGGNVTIINSILRGPKEICPAPLVIQADTLIIRNSIVNGIFLGHVNKIDTTGFFVNTQAMYYAGDYSTGHYVGDYRPSRYSPNIDKGIVGFGVGINTILAPTVDIDGISRNWETGNVIDIGPYEYRKDDKATPIPVIINVSTDKQMVCDEDQITLTASPATYSSYDWFAENGTLLSTTSEPSTTITLVNLNQYFGQFGPKVIVGVKVHDEFGNQASDQKEVLIAYPYPQQILCFVSVDTASQVNRLVWEATADAGIKSYIVYRETSVAGEFLALDTIPFAAAGIFYDMESKPGAGSSRYLIKVITSCDQLSDIYPQQAKKTIHLSASEGLNGEINLQWEPYDGGSLSTYKILRGTKTNNMAVIAEVSSSTGSFSDLTPPQGPKYYVVQAHVSTACSSNTLTENNVPTDGFVFSNRVADNVVLGLSEGLSSEFKVYPLPIRRNFSVAGPEPLTEIVILDLLGREQIRIGVDGNSRAVELDKGNLPAGIYFVRISGLTKEGIKKIFIE